jgi:hypothetical protein
LQDCIIALGRAFSEMVDMLRVHNTEARLLCVLHMLTETMHSFGGLPTEVLYQLVAALDTYHCWPCPFGPLAQQLLSLAERELASPGAALRDSFLSEHPELSSVAAAAEGDGRPSEFPLILDSSAHNSEFLEIALGVPLPDECANRAPVQLAVELLLDILQGAGAQVLELPAHAETFLARMASSSPDVILSACVPYPCSQNLASY